MKTNIAILDIRLKKINETRNYLLEKIKHNYLTSWKHKKVCRTLNYILAVSGCVSISAFASLVGVPVGIAVSKVGLKVSAITARDQKV